MSDDPAKQSSNVDREELFHLVVESATGFAIMSLDDDGTVQNWNIGCERLLGFTEPEMLGHSADVIFLPEDRAAGMPIMERSTARTVGRAEDERWHQRKDGSRFWGSGLMMPLRKGGGFVKIMRDRTAHRLAEEHLALSEERFRILATNIPQLVFRTRDTGARTWGSPQWEVYAGLSDERSREFGWLKAVHPDEQQTTLEAWAEARKTGRYSVEHRIRRAADDEYRWHQTPALPAPGRDEGEREWVGTSTDIHELLGLQNRQEVLLAELQHRTRNVLALVQAIARKTMRSASSLEEFGDEFGHRLTALSRVQSLVSTTSKATLPLRKLVEAELIAHGEAAGERIQISGPDTDLPTTSVQTLALVLHELATNAVKYGAIGQPAARLLVKWHVEGEKDQPGRIILSWLESGVVMPDPSVPKRKGYGSELIERALPYQLNAKTRLVFHSDGVHCEISIPVSRE